ncbi:hypothetical protein Ancab_036440 [Ancistrocladus abbreviatus]
MLVKSAAIDSLLRVPCSPKEIHSADSEKGDHRSSDKHARLKEGGSKLAKLSRVSSSQDKMECLETECDQRVQRVPQEKAEHREKTSDREGMEYRDESVGPTPGGPTNTEEGIVLTQGALA